MRVGSINVALLHYWELNFKFLRCCLFDLQICVFLLVQKLAAREANNLKTALLVPIVELYKLHVVFFSEGSLGSDVDDYSTLLLLHEIPQNVLIQFEISHANRPKFAYNGLFTPIVPSFPRRFKANAPLSSISHLRRFDGIFCSIIYFR